MKAKILQPSVLFTIIAILGAALVFETVQNHRLSRQMQPNVQSAVNSRQQTLHQKFAQTMAQDRKNHTQAQLQEAEQLYQVGNKKWGTPEAIESLKTMIKKYPDVDRTGCATLYLAQMTEGDERAKYLQSCIDNYNDCYYGDGVQVGVYARFLLIHDYRSVGDTQKAEALCNEIKTKYAGAIDHGGNLLMDSLKAGSN